MLIKNKTVLVTGGAVRIGRKICIGFAEAGAKVIIHYNKSGKEAAALLEALGGKKAGHNTVKCELSNLSAVEKLIPSLGKIDILINNASVYFPCPLGKENIEQAKNQFTINLHAPLMLMKKFQAQKIKEGCIINLLDQRIAKISPNDGSYTLSKKALAEATCASALQWAPRIRVNGIAPGAVLPPIGMENSKMKIQISMTPMKKAPTPEEISKTCIFLAENDSVTGQIIFVDGGQHL
jgi:NAD(P)-dependent dehydrogenase (short-subunit alcohol dehydrogenase family)